MVRRNVERRKNRGEEGGGDGGRKETGMRRSMTKQAAKPDGRREQPENAQMDY